MSADTSPLSGVWKRAMPTLARATEKPEIAKSITWIHAQLGKLADDPERGDDFDRKLSKLAGALQDKGVLSVDPKYPANSQGCGFLLACYAATHPASDELHAVFIAQLDRRAAREGKLFCRWRGYVPVAQFDAWRYDDYERRSKLANKGEKERAA